MVLTWIRKICALNTSNSTLNALSLKSNYHKLLVHTFRCSLISGKERRSSLILLFKETNKISDIHRDDPHLRKRSGGSFWCVPSYNV